jgi:hypothetical protein
MVYNHIDLILGFRITDEEACSLLLDMTKEEYEKCKKNEDVGSVLGLFLYEDEAEELEIEVYSPR